MLMQEGINLCNCSNAIYYSFPCYQPCEQIKHNIVSKKKENLYFSTQQEIQNQLHYYDELYVLCQINEKLVIQIVFH